MVWYREKGVIDTFTLNATDVRKDWGGFIDSLVREKPKFIKRSRDFVFASSLDMMTEMLKVYTFSADFFKEEDNSITLSLREIDIVVNGDSFDKALDVLTDDLIGYANDFYADFEYWFSAPNRKDHLPYVINVLVQEDRERVKGIIKCQDGKN